MRSNVENTLVNYLLGQTFDQYLDFGENDSSSRKNFKLLKLRLNHHRAIFTYMNILSLFRDSYGQTENLPALHSIAIVVNFFCRVTMF